MKRISRVKTGVAVVLALAIATRAYGFLGIGDIVFDPSNYGQTAQQLIEMERQYTQLVQSYRMLRSQYEHWVRMAQRLPVNMAVRYGIQPAIWQAFSAADTHGAASGWINAINSGLGMAAAYSQSIEALGAYGSGLANIPASHIERVKAAHGTVELTDGANLNALQMIGRLRANAAVVESALGRLQDDSYSSAPEMNTEIAVLNKINAAGLAGVYAARDTNQLLVSLTEQQVIGAKRARDAEARAINQHIRFVAEGKAAVMAQASGASQAMRAWRMP